MDDVSRVQGLSQAVQRYFDLMYDSDTSRFDRVFRSSAQLHGFRDGQMSMWPAQTFKEILGSRPSPKSVNAPREEEILLMDFASANQALVKVPVTISPITGSTVTGSSLRRPITSSGPPDASARRSGRGLPAP